jgi:hypothetical protein
VSDFYEVDLSTCRINLPPRKPMEDIGGEWWILFGPFWYYTAQTREACEGKAREMVRDNWCSPREMSIACYRRCTEPETPKV